MSVRLVVLLAVLFVGLAGCHASRLSPEAALQAAGDADVRGQSREAAALYRRAARAGSLDAAFVLAGRGIDKHTLGDWLFDPRPTHAEARRWEARVRRGATRQIAAGDSSGHLTLAWMAINNGQATGDMNPDSAAVARRHYDAAIALGSRRAIQGRAMLVWMSDGLLAAEPYFRESARAGFAQGAEMGSFVVLNRPLLERGLHPRDAPGDLAQVYVVGSIRFLQSAGFRETAAEAEEKTDALRAQARAGNAEADSLLRALGP